LRRAIKTNPTRVPVDLWMFPSPAWIKFLKGKGYEGTSIGKDHFVFDQAKVKHVPGASPAVPAPGPDGGGPDAAATTEAHAFPGGSIEVTGKGTFNHKGDLKRLGARWDKDKKAWILKDLPAIRQTISRMRGQLDVSPKLETTRSSSIKYNDVKSGDIVEDEFGQRYRVSDSVGGAAGDVYLQGHMMDEFPHAPKRTIAKGYGSGEAWYGVRKVTAEPKETSAPLIEKPQKPVVPGSGTGNAPSAVQIAAANSYIKRITNPGKKTYAQHYRDYLLGKGPQPDSSAADATLSYMAAQAVRMELTKILGEPKEATPPAPPTPPPSPAAEAPGPIPNGTWMNDYEIERAVERYKNHPILSRATKFLRDFSEETNEHSDGWHSWPLPGNAAVKLMGMIQHPEYASEDNFKKALAPIRSFYTRRGDAAGMKFPEIEGEKKPAEPSVLSPRAWADTFQPREHISFTWKGERVTATVIGRQNDELAVTVGDKNTLLIGTPARQEDVRREPKPEVKVEPPTSPAAEPLNIQRALAQIQRAGTAREGHVIVKVVPHPSAPGQTDMDAAHWAVEVNTHGARHRTGQARSTRLPGDDAEGRARCGGTRTVQA